MASALYMSLQRHETNHCFSLPMLCYLRGKITDKFVVSLSCRIFMEAEGIIEILPWNFCH